MPSAILPSLSSVFLHLRNRHFLLLDLAALAATPTLALALRLDGFARVGLFAAPVLLYTVGAAIVRLVVFERAGLYRRFWRYASVSELSQLTLAVLASSAIVVASVFLLRQVAPGNALLAPIEKLPRSVPFIDSLLVLLLIGLNRFSVRVISSLQQRSGVIGARRVAIMGAGEAGAMIVRELRNNPQLGMEPVGFFDDDPQKKGVRIHGLPVLGDRHSIAAAAVNHRMARVVIAMPTAPGRTIRDIVATCEAAGVDTKIMPGLFELLDGTVSVNQLRDVQIEDLLRREPVSTDTAAVAGLVRGRRVLVTGGGGSIGGELCRQLRRFRPDELVVLGHGENSVFEIVNELASAERSEPEQTRVRLASVIADIRFPDRVQALFDRYRPDILFHAAAHKHVPLMELNPCEAVTNNVIGTRNLVDAAIAAGVDRFIMVSTDKAVNPTSIMGASKRAAELVVHGAAEASGKPYVAVRFGNVLGSRGSVLHTFRQQIAAGGPVTVTHPDMTRYFMTIPEAVQLVLQAATLGTGGEVFVLDMGEPLKIADLARDVIRLSGLEPDVDIEVVYSGVRPGEKLTEELFVSGELYRRTDHEKILIAANASSFVPKTLDAALAEMAKAASQNDHDRLRWTLQELVPEFEPAGETVAGRE